MMDNILDDVRLKVLSRFHQLDVEIQQCREEGLDISLFEKDIADLRTLDPESAEAEAEAVKLYHKLDHAPLCSDYCYCEPQSLDEIIEGFPAASNTVLSKADLADKIRGALLGRTAGCLLGQPVEGWDRARITGFAKDTNNYPIQRYMSSAVADDIAQRYDVQDYPPAYGNAKKSWLNNISGAPEDDDTNYTVLGLYILEKYGRNFSPLDAAEALTTNIPVFMTHTAERMAYKNIVNHILPPDSAAHANPYREWLGAQIRVDSYAFVNAGNPQEAAEMALRDASVTHTKNGLYGAVFCAALIAEAATAPDMRTAIEKAVTFVPAKSRLYEALIQYLEFYDSGADAEASIAYVHQRYNEKNLHEWCHTIPNDLLICAALLYGGEDFTRVVAIAVEAGFDTDCNAATAGSAYGMMYGSEAIPKHFSEPLNGGFLSRVGFGGHYSFDDLVTRLIAQYSGDREKEGGNEKINSDKTGNS